MRIPGDLLKIAGIYGTQKSAGRIGKTEAVSSKKDVLSISSEAKDIQAVYRALRDTPDIRLDKVTELSGRYEAGSYDVSGREIADKVMNTVFDKKA